MLILDSFLNECCFKGSSMDLKVQRNKKKPPRYLGHWGVLTLGYIGHRVALTPRYLGHWGVMTPQCLELFWIFSG